MNINSPEFIVSQYRDYKKGNRGYGLPGIKLIHVPTRLTVRCSHTISSHKNLALCIISMKAALYVDSDEQKMLQRNILNRE